MLKWTFIFIIIPFVVNQCANQCLTCQLDSNPYACTTCINDSPLYLWSCSYSNIRINALIAVTIIITILHLFMLCLGIGIYRQIFQYIQLISLISWRYGFQGSSYVLQGTNLSLITDNSFIGTFGIQFIFILIIFAIFGLGLFLTSHVKNNQKILLLRRKTIIFPTRIITFFFNILLYTSLTHIVTSIDLKKIQVWPLIYSIFGFLCLFGMLIFIIVVSNYRKFQVDDPHYYVLVQLLTNKRWYAKNNILFNLLNRFAIILSFIVIFKQPKIAGILMLIAQFVYTVYFIFLIRFKKIRYFTFIMISNILTLCILLTIFIGSTNQINSQLWTVMSLAFQIMYYLLVFIFFLATALEIAANMQKIIKQLKSMYIRFIKCESDKQIIANKFDEHVKHEKVTQFHTNLLYKIQIPVKEIQLIVLPNQ